MLLNIVVSVQKNQRLGMFELITRVEMGSAKLGTEEGTQCLACVPFACAAHLNMHPFTYLVEKKCYKARWEDRGGEARRNGCAGRNPGKDFVLR